MSITVMFGVRGTQQRRLGGWYQQKRQMTKSVEGRCEGGEGYENAMDPDSKLHTKREKKKKK
jgi:hypothetical protein